MEIFHRQNWFDVQVFVCIKIIVTPIIVKGLDALA